jgi:hypothetical protein
MRNTLKHWGCPKTFMLLLCCLAAVPAFGQPRPSSNLDGPWAFRMDPENVGETEQWFAAPVAFADTIQVPGAWEAQGFGGETDKLHHHFIGKGWYKRQADIPADWSGRRVFLCIGGVHRYAAVWVNGKYFGEHIGPLSPFEYDITDCAAPGTTALIAVRIDSAQRWDIDTLIGAWDIIDYMDTYWGGIWGHVKLEARNAAWLKDLFVEPAVAPARCRVSATVKGVPPEGAALRLDVLDKDKAIVAHAEAPLGAMELAVPGANLWTPDTPALYTARLSLLKGGDVIDTVETRFGFRQITIDGTRILLNGQPFFLRGYGDDAIYPKTMAAPSDEAFYRKKIGMAKDYGFNHVRHHSHFLPPEYYDVCDELGMLVSPELPIGYQTFYNKAKGPALELYKTEWAAAILRFRNHPSIFDWCMGNEMYDSIPIAPDLYRIAKELDTTRPVVDSDGVPTEGFTEGTRDRDTLDLYFTQFDVFNNPLDIPDLYRCPAPKKPVVSHETGNYVTFPLLDQIDLFKDNFKPFWLIAARDKVQRMGCIDEVPRWAENTGKLYTLLRKTDIEAIRKSPLLSGYHWWLFQDYWTTSNGIVDTYFRPKPGIDRDAILQFNNDVVLVQDGIDLAYRGGKPLQAALLVSNFGTTNLDDATLTYSAKQGDVTITEQSTPAPIAPQGALTELAKMNIPLPNVDAPARITVKVRLVSGSKTFTNVWSTWVYPAQVAVATAPLFASTELLPWLEARGAKALPSQKPYPTQAVYVSSQVTPELIDATATGASLILFKPQGLLPAATTRFKTAWWLGNESDNNAGTVVYDHPVTRAMAPEGWCDASWYRLLEGSDGYLVDELPAQPESIIRGIETAGVCRNKSMLFQAAVGKGRVILCGLNLDAALPDGTVCPPAEWLTARLVEYAATFPTPAVAIPETYFRERIVESPEFSAPFVEGFAGLVRNEGETGKWFTYRNARGKTEALHQIDANRVVEWDTAAAPNPLPGESLTFVFAGGLGWISQPKTDGFVLAMNGKDLLRFDVCNGRGLWRDDANRVTLSFVPHRSTSEDTAGLFYLGVPRGLIAPGQPCRLAVRCLGSGSQRWFALHPYTDVLGAK